MGGYDSSELAEMLHDKKCGGDDRICSWDIYHSFERRRFRKDAIRLLKRWGDLTKEEIDVLVEHTV